jgi:hypothetical protein
MEFATIVQLLQILMEWLPHQVVNVAINLLGLPPQTNVTVQQVTLIWAVTVSVAQL